MQLAVPALLAECIVGVVCVRRVEEHRQVVDCNNFHRAGDPGGRDLLHGQAGDIDSDPPDGPECIHFGLRSSRCCPVPASKVFASVGLDRNGKDPTAVRNDC